MSKHALHSAPHALHVAHVRDNNEHIRARHGRNDYVPRLVQGIPRARDDCNRSPRARIVQRSLAPDAARCACDEDDLSAEGLGGVQWLRVDGGVDAGGVIEVEKGKGRNRNGGVRTRCGALREDLRRNL